MNGGAVSRGAPRRSWRVRVPLLVLAAMLAAAASGCGGARRAYPRWVLADGAPHRAGCLESQAFVRVSGKTGVGMTVLVRSRGDCAVRLARAELVVGQSRFPAELPAAQQLPGRSLVYWWLPFSFDNETLWNDGWRRGQFELAFEVNGVPEGPWIIPATHEFVGGRRFHPDHGGDQ